MDFQIIMWARQVVEMVDSEDDERNRKWAFASCAAHHGHYGWKNKCLTKRTFKKLSTTAVVLWMLTAIKTKRFWLKSKNKTLWRVATTKMWASVKETFHFLWFEHWLPQLLALKRFRFESKSTTLCSGTKAFDQSKNRTWVSATTMRSNNHYTNWSFRYVSEKFGVIKNWYCWV